MLQKYVTGELKMAPGTVQSGFGRVGPCWVALGSCDAGGPTFSRARTHHLYLFFLLRLDIFWYGSPRQRSISFGWCLEAVL